MLKDINGYLITRNIRQRYLVKVRPFLGAGVQCMYDYSKPTIRIFDPEVIVLHVGTNELNSPKKSSEIAKSIIDLAASLKTCTNRIVISLIVPRGDDLNNKASEVNDRLKNMCLNRNYLYIDHSDSINVADHVNDGNLHLNKYGKAVLAKDFTNFLGNMD